MCLDRALDEQLHIDEVTPSQRTSMITKQSWNMNSLTRWENPVACWLRTIVTQVFPTHQKPDLKHVISSYSKKTQTGFNQYNHRLAIISSLFFCLKMTRETLVEKTKNEMTTQSISYEKTHFIR